MAKKVVKLAPQFADLPEQIKAALLPLTPGHRKFVAAYCSEANGNASEAARMAGYSPTSAPFQGLTLKRREDVRTAIAVWMDHYAATSTELTQRIADLAFHSDPGFFTHYDATDKTVKFKTDAVNWARNKHRIKSIKFDPLTSRVVEVQLYDAQKAQDTLAKIMKLYAPAQFNLILFYQKASNEELIAKAEEARKRLRAGGYVEVAV